MFLLLLFFLVVLPLQRFVFGDNNLQDFHPISVIGEGHFGKVLLVRWKNGARRAPPATRATSVSPRLAEEGDEEVEEQQINNPADGGSDQGPALDSEYDGDRFLAVKEVALHKGSCLPGVLNERQILGVLTEHPFVVTLRCAWRRGNFLYYGLDFLPGADLFELFRRNAIKMDLQSATCYGGQVALALEHLHAHGICYRDLKVRVCVTPSSLSGTKTISAVTAVIESCYCHDRNSSATVVVSITTMMLLIEAVCATALLRPCRLGSCIYKYDAKTIQLSVLGWTRSTLAILLSFRSNIRSSCSTLKDLVQLRVGGIRTNGCCFYESGSFRNLGISSTIMNVRVFLLPNRIEKKNRKFSRLCVKFGFFRSKFMIIFLRFTASCY